MSTRESYQALMRAYLPEGQEQTPTDALVGLLMDVREQVSPELQEKLGEALLIIEAVSKDRDDDYWPLDVYDPEFGDHRECKCGHTYERHFDPYEGMMAVGCKYCDCGTWEAP